MPGKHSNPREGAIAASASAVVAEMRGLYATVAVKNPEEEISA